MQTLLDALTRVKNNIQQHKNELINNEALTRYALVDVILNALGWDVHDPSKVFPEYNKGVGGRADYALLDQTAKPVAIVEAKKLSGITATDLQQVTNYAFNSGIKISVITDGNSWIVLDAFKQVPLPQKEVMRLNFATEPENHLFVKLVCLMPINLHQNMPYFPELNSTNLQPNVQINRPITPTIISQPIIAQKISPNNAPSGNWTPLTNFNKILGKPKQLKFPDGTIRALNSYNDILKQVAEWLISKNKLPSVPFEDSVQKKRFLINHQSTHKQGDPFKGNFTLSNGLHLETNYDAEGSVKNSIWLIQQAGDNPQNYTYQ